MSPQAFVDQVLHQRAPEAESAKLGQKRDVRQQYLFFGAIMGMAIFEPLGIANHTTTAAAGLSLACVWEMDSIVNHVLALHGDGRWEAGPAAQMLDAQRLEAVYGCRWRWAGGAWVAWD